MVCVVKQGGHLPLRDSCTVLSRRASGVSSSNFKSRYDECLCCWCRYKAYLRWEHYRCATFFRCVML